MARIQNSGSRLPDARSDPAGRYWVRVAVGLILLTFLAVPFFTLMVAVERQAPLILSFDARLADLLNDLARSETAILESSLFLTELGSAKVAVVVFLLASVALGAAGRGRLAAYVTAAGLGLAVLIPVSKALVDRPRPVLDTPVTELPGSASFPSGHAATAVVLFGCLTVVALCHPLPRWGRMAVVAAAIALSVAVGLTRLTLGVHYASDVVAGWSFGAAWLAITTGALHRRRRDPPVKSQPAVIRVPALGSSDADGGTTAVALLAAWGALAAASVLAGLVIAGPLASTFVGRADTEIARLVVDLRSDALTDVAKAGSAPTDVIVALAAALAAAMLLATVTRSGRSSLFLIVSLGGASSAYFVSSRIVERIRPDVTDLTSSRLPEAASWPSGHVAAAVALYGALAVLLAPTRRSAAYAVGVVTVLAIVLVGGSRLYVAAHYASDVLGGAALGTAWLLICTRLMRPPPANLRRQHPHTDLMVRPVPNREGLFQ